METLPETLGDLEFLEMLHLEASNLRELPASAVHLKSLRELVLAGNQTLVVDSLFDKLPTSLEHLDLASCGLEYLPDSVRRLVKLKSLTLVANSLTTLPNALAELSGVEFLE